MDWMAIHFGKNPNKGGSPPRDMRRIDVENWKKVLDLEIENSWILEKIFLDINKTIIGTTIKT